MHGNLPWGLVLSVLACHSHLDTQQAWAYICSVNDRPSEQMVQVLYIWDMLLSSVDNSPCASIRLYIIWWCIEQCREYWMVSRTRKVQRQPCLIQNMRREETSIALFCHRIWVYGDYLLMCGSIEITCRIYIHYMCTVYCTYELM